MSTSAARGVNYAANDERGDTAFGPNYNCLIEPKRHYDPGNLFRLNQKIVL